MFFIFNWWKWEKMPGRKQTRRSSRTKVVQYSCQMTPSKKSRLLIELCSKQQSLETNLRYRTRKPFEKSIFADCNQWQPRPMYRKFKDQIWMNRIGRDWPRKEETCFLVATVKYLLRYKIEDSKGDRGSQEYGEESGSFQQWDYRSATRSRITNENVPRYNNNF